VLISRDETFTYVATTAGLLRLEARVLLRNGCTVVVGQDVDVSTNLDVTIVGDTTFCTGDTTVLSASAGTEWLWSTGARTQQIRVVRQGQYSVIATSGSCVDSARVTVVEIPLPNPVIVATATEVLPNDSIIIRTTRAFDGYQWSNGSTSNSIVVRAAGTYSVRVTSNGCSAESNVIVITEKSLPTFVFTPQPIRGIVGSVHNVSTMIVCGSPLPEALTLRFEISVDASMLVPSIPVAYTIDGQRLRMTFTESFTQGFFGSREVRLPGTITLGRYAFDTVVVFPQIVSSTPINAVVQGPARFEITNVCQTEMGARLFQPSSGAINTQMGTTDGVYEISGRYLGATLLREHRGLFYVVSRGIATLVMR
jgi:hypothetical protein